MKLKDKRPVFRITLLGLALALYIALSFLTIDMQFLKLSFAGLPIIFIAVVLGPYEAAGIGLIGEFAIQMTTFGFTPTTFLWCLPAVVRGLIVGFMFKEKDVRKHPYLWIITIIISCIAVTAINTFVIYIDAKIFEYPSELTTITVIIRFVNSVITAVIYAIVLPLLFLPLIHSNKFETSN